ncbi:hypothetical protein [Chengkuizengella axinellae]|uniref:Uncharacterized protein n=1 Tax=Chengkuizengella axinellae TaxID=3064388 RepID=A0ABT9J2F2_9BACL|nr:hypothetical protein [Chengkuizengella sp. 2205SS18-9]MDP5275791.1 hypothetical protein [Chengkuizengella sp. 2205SS18-9]
MAESDNFSKFVRDILSLYKDNQALIETKRNDASIIDEFMIKNKMNDDDKMYMNDIL